MAVGVDVASFLFDTTANGLGRILAMKFASQFQGTATVYKTRPLIFDIAATGPEDSGHEVS